MNLKNDLNITQSTQKHLGMVLDTKLDFNLLLTNLQSKVNKTIGLLCKLKILYQKNR